MKKFAMASTVLVAVTATHRTHLDSYERLQPGDMTNAPIAGSFAYLALNRGQKLPRKPFPAPPAGGGSAQ